MEQPINKDLSGLIVNKQYKLQKKLGSGAFGEIYLAQNINPNAKCNQKEVAIKIEKADAKHPQILFEAKLYSYLNQHIDKTPDKSLVPKFFNCVTEQGYNFLVMELLGKSLEDLFSQTNRRFSLKTVVLLALQMLDTVEFLHSKQFIHRDIKPDNFLAGHGAKSHKIFMVDLGLAKRYISKDGHIPYKENKSLTGTARYASINTHLGIEQARRDDLESLGYVLMYFLRGYLPWQNLRANNQKEKYERIMEKKLATSTEVLCRGYPNEFADYLNYVKNLKFDEKPDYQYLKGLFQEVMNKNSFEWKYVYDWDDSSIEKDKRISFSVDIRQNTLEKEKEKEKDKDKEKVRQSSQPHSQEDITKAVGNYFNSSTQNVVLMGSTQEKLPSIGKPLNNSALNLIKQLQQHQQQLKSSQMVGKRNSSNQVNVSQPLHQSNNPVKTSSMHSIQMPLQRSRQVSVNHQKAPTSSLQKTFYQPKSMEKGGVQRIGRNIKQSSKFMVSQKLSQAYY